MYIYAVDLTAIDLNSVDLTASEGNTSIVECTIMQFLANYKGNPITNVVVGNFPNLFAIILFKKLQSYPLSNLKTILMKGTLTSEESNK